jgi:hypothetical protein
MTAASTKRLWRMFVLASVLALCSAPTADAQFETPNRQFHNEKAFPLEGRHRDVPCASCHQQGTYKGTPTTCLDCHWTRRQDDRFRLQLGTRCEECHRPTTWTAVQWDHDAMTGMPLGAAHRQLSCQSCHSNDSFRTTQTTCFSCHQKEFQATRTPNHVAAGFPTTCETCHKVSDTTFQQARVDHAAAFPLVGVHAQQTCVSCHRNNVFQGTSRDCVGCHRPLYDRTTAPNHAAAGFPTTCENCHRPTDVSWQGNGFNHSSVFALVGRHAQTACASCHVNNVFRGTARDCVGCHRTSYERTTAPSHAAAGFPTTCDNCHRASDTTWTQGTFNHRFPITSGPHRVSCTTCHQGGGSFQTFTCLVCHEHDRARMDDKHKERAGYRYDSLACYSCHPNGRH